MRYYVALVATVSLTASCASPTADNFDKGNCDRYQYPIACANYGIAIRNSDPQESEIYMQRYRDLTSEAEAKRDREISRYKVSDPSQSSPPDQEYKFRVATFLKPVALGGRISSVGAVSGLFASKDIGDFFLSALLDGNLMLRSLTVLGDFLQAEGVPIGDQLEPASNTYGKREIETQPTRVPAAVTQPFPFVPRGRSR